MEAKRLFRSRKHKMFGGVCGGLSNYFNIDVVLVRLFFVIGIPFSCIFPFVLTYVALWIAAPLEAEISNDGYQPKDDLDASNSPENPENPKDENLPKDENPESPKE